ncbi:MAG: spondin domain-containing protein [Gammaproteobacteria bacterium]|nr:spondin domain-containing protein [Gammaproteobacteria bacterium]MDH5694195.1 spondin domain-containing protein [Gammaproteobacteria bacterium]
MKFSIKIVFGILFIGSLTACSDSGDDEEGMSRFQIRVSNVSANQPLTPVAVVLHQSGYQAWSLGSAASNGLEKLAEGGDTADFLAAANADATVSSTAVGTGVIVPGASETITIAATEKTGFRLSLASMLANTNDAFTGFVNHSVSSMKVGESHTVYAKVYDAGTEANSEASGTIPGPADGGTGFDASRDDLIDKVTIHAGVVSVNDDLASSVLTESHRWNGSVAKIEITRM